MSMEYYHEYKQRNEFPGNEIRYTLSNPIEGTYLLSSCSNEASISRHGYCSKMIARSENNFCSTKKRKQIMHEFDSMEQTLA